MSRGITTFIALLATLALGAAPPRPTPEGAPAAPAPSPTPVSRVTRQLLNRKLQLPSYARYGTDPFGDAIEVPAFSEVVEVTARPMDTASLTAKMQWWMDDFEPVYAGAGAARFHAPTLAEMREHRPSPPQAADFTPLLGWLLGKLGKNDDKKK